MRGSRSASRAIAAGMLVCSIIASFTSSPASAATASNPHAVPGRALVRFKPGTDDALRRIAHLRAHATVVSTIKKIGYEVVSFDAPADAVLASYRNDPNVLRAEPDYTASVALAPGDSCLGVTCDGVAGQWHHAMTNAPGGWDAFPARTYTATEKKGLAKVTIAVLDTKIDQTNPDWINQGGASADARDGGQLDIADARDWIASSKQTGAASYHGTFVAGLAGAATGNDRDAAGVAYAATILPLTVVDGGGMTDSAALAEAIVYARDRGARVINLSLGTVDDSSAVHDAIKLVAPTSLVVAAAGNNTGNTPFYPGSYPEVLSVAGTDANDRPASCSNYNSNVGVSAPADRLIGIAPMPNERIQAPCGTSAATPQVSGLAALLFMQDPSRTPAQVRALIVHGADDLGPAGRDDRFGAGRINIERSLRAGGASVTGARADVAAAGSTAIAAVATAARGVTRAQLVFDKPDNTPVAMSAADGSFGGTTENLTLGFTIPAGTAPGPHPAWIRAFDGSAWGAAAVTVVAVDARAPVISGVSATNAVRAANQPVVLTFTATDDYSTVLTYAVEFRSTATGALVRRETIASVPAGAQRYSWMPALDVTGGHYKIKIGVVDRAGNASTAEAGTVIT